MKDRRWLVVAAVAVAALQIGFLVSMIAGRAAILRDGREVVLQVRPVDPRDLLRGDYVTIGYNVSTVPVSLFAARPDEALRGAGETVFVRLAPGEDGIWQPVAARYGEPPEASASPDEVDIRGTVAMPWADSATEIPIDYGIERFYVPEGEGRAIEAGIGERSFRMKVAVADDGTAQIKSFHDGETLLYAEPLY
jgi:uncharacterized membrane-anchored protein